MIDKFLEAMDDDKEYDFIANNYPHMSKFDLRTILLEYIYASKRDDEIKENVRDELETRNMF